jgi:hypothetical protein
LATAVPVLAQLGASDCERLASGLLAQPVNSVSSLAFVGVGLAIALSTSRRPMLGARSYVFAGLVAAIGFGSVAFHGPQPVGARLLHDLPIVVALLFMVLDNLDRLRPRSGRLAVGLVGGSAAAALLAAAWPDAAMAFTALLVLAVGVTEVEVYRLELRPLSRPDQRRAYAAIAGILAVGLAFFWLGRTDNALCDPAARVQWHGAWHVASSAAFATWWWLAFAMTGDRRPTGRRHPAPQGDLPAPADRSLG